MSRRIKRSPNCQSVGVLTQLQLSSLSKSILGSLLCVLLLLLLLLLHHLMLLLLMMANLLFVGNPYWFSLLRLGKIGSVNHVGVPITCHPVRKNIGGFY